MATIKAVNFERSRIGRGIKIAALVLVLTAGALTADHVFFVAPSAQPTAAPITVKATTVTTAATVGFALPDSIRPTTADAVAEQAPTY